MSEMESKSFVSLLGAVSSSSDDESKKSSPKTIRHKVIMPVNHSSKKKDKNSMDTINNNSSQEGAATTNAASGSWNISPIPTPKSIKHNINNNNNSRARMMYGQLTPAGRSMTPTCQGRIKAPPICSEPALQKVASDVSEFADKKVCFSSEEAESCAAQARELWISHYNNSQYGGGSSGGGVGINNGDDNVPLNIDGIGEYWKIHAESAAAAAEVKAYVSSNSTVVTNTSASSLSFMGGRGGGGGIAGGSSGSLVGTGMTPSSAVASTMAAGGGGGIPTAASRLKKDRPPLEVVRTDNEETVVHSEDEQHLPPPAANPANEANPANDDVATTSSTSSALPLSRDFTDKLVKGNSSRQGRSLQRWLVHSQTEELVRQVAGTVPITRDGRIVLVSASRKSEWILPKGGWDADETREECAARETFEEAGLLGRLGACMEPIDYETSKAKKRRLSMMTGGGERDDKMAGLPLPKRIKKLTGGEGASSYSPTGPELSEDGGAAKSRSKLAVQSSSPAKPSNSDPKNYSYVRLLLFPLYISEVKNDWPEKGRLRKIVDIDDAIKIMEKEDRGYFKKGLEMIKDRGLHLLKPAS